MQSQKNLSDEQLDAHIDNLICRKKKDPNAEVLIPALTDMEGEETEPGDLASVLGLSACEQTAATFEAEMPAMDLRQLQGQDYSDINHIRSNTSLHDIGSEWQDIKQNEKRKRQARLIQVDGHDVLRQNNYDMDTGELSVFGRELSAADGGKTQSNSGGKKRGGAQVAGRDYTHESLCLACQDGGDLLLCDLCPRSWHIECLEGTHCTDPDRPGKWQCPHHRCSVCDKAAAAAGGLLFRCRACPNAYCEDHLPEEHIIIGKCPRLEPLGFRHPPQACYVHCNAQCSSIAARWREAPLESFIHPNVGGPTNVLGAAGPGTVGSSTKRKRSRCINERLITNNDYNLSWTDRSQNKVILASASFSGMKDYLVRQLGSKFRLYNGQLLSKIAAMMSGCQTGGEIFWELYILARRLLLRPEERWRLRPEGDMEADLQKAQKRSEMSAAREAERLMQEQRMEERRLHLEALRQQRREQRRVAIHGEPQLDEWEDEPCTAEEKAEMAQELKDKMKETAFGYLRLKGALGATLIQMKAAKLFKHMVNRSKLKGLGIDLPQVLEELMDDRRIRCTTDHGSSSKRVTALSAFMAHQQHWLPDSRLAWLQLAGRTQEEMDFMMDCDNILRNQIMDFMKSKRTCSRAAVYIAKPVNDIIRRVTYLQRESGIPYALSLLDNVLRDLVESGKLLTEPPLQPAPPPRIEHSTMFKIVSSGNSPIRTTHRISSYEVLYPDEEEDNARHEKDYFEDEDDEEEKEYFDEDDEDDKADTKQYIEDDQEDEDNVMAKKEYLAMQEEERKVKRQKTEYFDDDEEDDAMLDKDELINDGTELNENLISRMSEDDSRRLMIDAQVESHIKAEDLPAAEDEEMEEEEDRYPLQDRGADSLLKEEEEPETGVLAEQDVDAALSKSPVDAFIEQECSPQINGRDETILKQEGVDERNCISTSNANDEGPLAAKDHRLDIEVKELASEENNVNRVEEKLLNETDVFSGAST